MVIKRSDRLSDLFGRDERMLDAFVASSRVFSGLRNAKIRRTMGRLSTVEQAARVAGLDPDYLVAKLNRVLRNELEIQQVTRADEAEPTAERKESTMDSIDTGIPSALAHIPEAEIVEIDVREDLRNGQEPFSQIMAARRDVAPGGALCVRAIFEPAPLYAVMAKQGFAHVTEQLGDEDWRVWFYPPDASSDSGTADSPLPADDTAEATISAAAPARIEAPAEEGGEEDIVVLDVRGMEPPEPMVLTLAALENLPAGKTLLQINERVPQFLLPKLESLGFAYEVREQGDALVRVFIRHRG